ncbi:GAR domain-containing protein [Pseudozyma hubeiensis]|nr:GAR domain-containing protein [Pseudozyma hubeiensis]
MLPPDKLSSQDYVELTRISRKKDDIEHHIANLHSWAPWNPFKDVSTYSADFDRLEQATATLDALSSSLNSRKSECSRLEQDVEHFNSDDMKRLRSVAKAVSKRHLSGPDTDLLELALETVFALDKLLRLLRERRHEHELTDLRLQWERTVCSAWADVADLRLDIKAFEVKCNTLAASHSGSLVPLSDEKAEQQTSDGDPTRTDVQHRRASQHIPRSASASSRLALESLKLECSRLVLRIRSFDTEKARPAANLLDLLIDQRQIPEKLIDEQERLEDALPQPSAIEAESSKTLSMLHGFSLSASTEHDSHTPMTAAASSMDPILAAEPKVSDPSSSSSLPVAANTTPRTREQLLKSTDRPRKVSSSSLHATPVRHASNHCRSSPRNALDVAIGEIVNRLPISVSIKNASLADSAPSSRIPALQDLSGQYWIGDPDPRLCFCRILPSNTVMVRVGGGWQELSEFLTQHFAHLSIGDVQGTARLPNAMPASNLNWMRSASGPVGSPRLRTMSSVESLRSHRLTRKGVAQASPRIVTMPSMTTPSNLTPVNKAGGQNPSITEPRQLSFEYRDRSFSSPCKTSDLPSSGSASSIVIHPSSPSS